MKTYVRAYDGRVVEIIQTGGDPSRLFHPELEWTAVDGVAASSVAVNWVHAHGAFTAPAVVVPSATPVTLATLQSQIDELTAKLAALSPHA